jgi:hypothetical protein
MRLGVRVIRPKIASVAVMTLALGVLGVVAAPSAEAAVTLNVSTPNDIAANAGACGNTSIAVPSPLSLREATCIANNYGNTQAVTINIPAGHYTLTSGELTFGDTGGANITLSGAGSASTVIDGNHASRVLDIDSSSIGGVTASLSGLTVTGGSDSTWGGGGISAGAGNSVPTDALSLTDVVVSGNASDVAAPTATDQPGGGLFFQGGALTITNSTFTGNTSNSSIGSGVFFQGINNSDSLTVTNSTFSGNSTANSAASTTTDGGALATIAAAGATVTVTNSRFTGNTATGTSGNAAGAGIYAQGGALTVTGSTFTGNSVSGGPGTPTGGAIYSAASSTTLHYNRFTGNTAASGSAVAQTSGTADATQNWWGCSTGPGTAGCDSITSGTVNATPRLVLTATAGPSHLIGPNGTATITAALTTDSAGNAVAPANLTAAFDGLPVSFADPPGDATVTLTAGPHSVNLANGAASIDYHSNTTTGPDNVAVTLDNGTVSAILEVDQAPAITSANTAHFTVGSAGSFTITTTGYPNPAITETGSLPSGLTFHDNGDGSATISGTAAASSGGNYPLNLTANNGIAPNASQTLTVNVSQPPAFTSGATATFVIGSAGSFTVTTSGFPTVSTITESGSLPAGITFTDNGDGTATIAGTPTGTGNTYPVTLTAANGVSPNASQNLTIQVNQAPAVTLNPTDQTTAPGTSVSFIAAASGVPTPTVQWQRSTDGGASFTNIAGATSTTYTFTTAAGDDGNQYRAVFSNGVGSPATTTAATLHVGIAPAFLSADHVSFVVGSAGSFSINTSGVPDATLSRTGAQFPAWLTLTDNGDGTGALTGTPPAGSAGTYQFTLKAANGFSPSASQTFTLFVDDSPVITSTDHTTFTTGQAGSFPVATTAGFPTTTAITETGSLPSGVTFTDNGDGTATLAGTPAAGTGGSYPITITATAIGGLAAPATQSFTLTVLAPPTITSADHTTFAVGTAGSFDITTAPGNPTTTTLDVTGTLPNGISFTDNGDGTATLAGTPAAHTAGTYLLTITASNGVRPDSTQSFTLTATDVPMITSSDHTTFSIGSAGSFTITTDAGFPAATTLTESGSLPSGVTFTDNGDGTATLAGTPDHSTEGSYPLTLTATNSVGHTDQAFTLTVAQKAQTITVTSTPPSPAQVGGSYPLAATSDSGLDVVYSIDPATTNSACSLTGSTVSLDAAGTCVVDFDQPGDGTYAAATQVQQSITVTKVGTAVAVTTSPATSVYGQQVHATATVTADRGTPSGTVQFTVDGTDVGSPVTVTGGTAVSSLLTGSGGTPLAPGSHPVVAVFTPDDAATYAASTGSATQVVSQAATMTALTVHAHDLTASVAAVAPGSGTPSGTVTFSVGGHAVGTAALTAGRATFTYTVPAGHANMVAATYSGDPNYTGSSASTTRRDPTITARVSSSHSRSRYGWYNSPVTVSFTCITAGAPLTAPCPAPVVLRHQGAGQSVTRTISAGDGGTATVAVRGINIDTSRPAVAISGVRNGASYSGTAPRARCAATDRLSGVASCTLTSSVRGTRTTYRATATDRAGNTAITSVTVTVLAYYLAGAPYKDGAFTVRVGHTYTLVVNGAGTRPVFYDAAVYPRTPTKRDNAFLAAGHHRWTLGVYMQRNLRTHTYWNIGVKIGGTMHVIKIRIA